MNSGGPAYTDSLGQLWSADSGFTGGSTYSVTSAIANTNDPALYQNERWGSFSYNFTVPVGTYSVTLKFAETSFSSGGQRDVSEPMFAFSSRLSLSHVWTISPASIT